MNDYSNKEFVLAEVSKAGWNLEFAHEDLKKDREVVLTAVAQHGSALYYASESLKTDKEVVLAAVNKCGCALRYASESLKTDKEVVLAAVSEDRWAIIYASEYLRDDKYFLYEIDQIKKIIKGIYIYDCLNRKIQNKIDKNPDYLLKFEPVNFKPARS